MWTIVREMIPALDTVLRRHPQPPTARGTLPKGHVAGLHVRMRGFTDNTVGKFEAGSAMGRPREQQWAVWCSTFATIRADTSDAAIDVCDLLVSLRA